MQSPDQRAAVQHPIAPAIKLSPSTGSPMRLVECEPTCYTFRKVEFIARGFIWECPDTQQRYSTPDQVDAVLAHVHRQWRTHLGIGREALRGRRVALGLSAAQASALLGFGINQYSTYEQTDKLPSQSNAVLLQQLVSDPGIAALLEGEAARQALKPAARRRLQQYVAALVPMPALNRPPITATGSDVAGNAAGSLSERSSQKPKRVVRNKGPRRAQTRQGFLTNHQLIALPAGDYSYAMAA